MKPRKAKDLRELTYEELERMLQDSVETLSRLRFQHSLSQLHDTASIKILRKDIARLKLILAKKQKQRTSTKS